MWNPQEPHHPTPIDVEMLQISLCVMQCWGEDGRQADFFILSSFDGCTCVAWMPNHQRLAVVTVENPEFNQRLREASSGE